MTLDLKKKFNELSALSSVMQAWGSQAKDSVPKAAMVAVVLTHMARKAFVAKEKLYTLQHHSAYHNLLKNGPDSVGYEEACRILERTLKDGNRNTKVALTFMGAKKARQFMPQVENAAELRRLAMQYKIGSLKKLLPKM